MGTPSNIRLGPGLLYIAPLGTAEPTTLSAAADVGFVAVGYTETGSEIDVTTSYDDVEVAEELDPVAVIKTKRLTTVKFIAAEITARKMQIALNGGTIGAPTAGYVTYDPPLTADTDIHVMLLWQADDLQDRWLFRECAQVGAIVIPHRKGKDMAKIPMEFRALVPATGLKPFKAWFAATRAA
jgi:hypothetical protein